MLASHLLPAVSGSRPQRVRQRRGLLTMELVMTLPILGIMILALLEFSLLFYARGLVVEASRAAARKATLAGTTDEVIEAEVRRVLSPPLQRGLRVGVDPAEGRGDPVTVAVQVPMTAATPDLLWLIGLSLEGRYLYSETTMIRE